MRPNGSVPHLSRRDKSLHAGPEFPSVRMRRNRQTDWSRRLVGENRLSADDLIWPVFVRHGNGLMEPVDSMPGVFRYSVDQLPEIVGKACDLGIPAVALFPFIEPELKDETGSYSEQDDNLVCEAVRAIKSSVPNLGIMCDVALDPYTNHGHDGVLDGDHILNDETVEILCRQALAQARAGCDIIAPSDMMDGRIGAIRTALDTHGFDTVQIMAYSAKYASAFYGPFRDAVGSSGTLGKASKSTYQMDPANTDEALREVALDIAEGADMIMVKPGMPYLDILRRVKDAFSMPTYAYQVSGEYAMISAACLNGYIDRDKAIMESLLGFKRAGADGILSYFAIETAIRLKSG